MKKWRIVLWAFVLACATGLDAAMAETRYVSDVLVITVREGPTLSSPTISHLKTGDSMEVLAKTDDMLRVRTPTGEEGWVRAPYTSTETPKAVVIARLKEELDRLKVKALGSDEAGLKWKTALEATKKSHADSLRALQGELSKTKSDASKASKELQEVRDQYELLIDKSRRVIEITKENDRLKTEHQQMSKDVKRLQDENSTLTRATATRWFLAGGGVFFAGWAIGAISRRKKGRRY